LVDKISRKDLKKPDEFFSLTKKIVTWLIEQRTALIVGAAALVVVIFTVFGWRWYSESKEKEASRLLVEAQKILLTQQNQRGENNTSAPGVDSTKSEEEKYRAAITGFEKVRKEFPNTDTATLAILYIGLYSQKLGDTDTAMEAYQEYLSHEGLKGVLASTAVEGIASSYESKQMTAQAIENYKRLCQPPLEAECDRGLYNLGRLEQAAGKLQEAADQFKSILEKYPNTQFRQDIQERLIMLPKPAVKSVEALTHTSQSDQSSLDPKKKEQ
jgi:tetratricopeptide (TPR) repeat protein